MPRKLVLSRRGFRQSDGSEVLAAALAGRPHRLPPGPGHAFARAILGWTRIAARQPHLRAAGRQVAGHAVAGCAGTSRARRGTVADRRRTVLRGTCVAAGETRIALRHALHRRRDRTGLRGRLRIGWRSAVRLCRYLRPCGADRLAARDARRLRARHACTIAAWLPWPAGHAGVSA